MEKWEYMTRVLYASTENKGAAEYAKTKLGIEKLAKFSPMTLMAELDQYGREGWEMVHIQPVLRGSNGDVAFRGGQGGDAYSSESLMTSPLGNSRNGAQ